MIGVLHFAAIRLTQVLVERRGWVVGGVGIKEMDPRKKMGVFVRSQPFFGRLYDFISSLFVLEEQPLVACSVEIVDVCIESLASPHFECST